MSEHIPSQRALHKFCKVPQATSSSHEQISFMPPLHFSALIVQRGSTQELIAGAAAEWAALCWPAAPPGPNGPQAKNHVA